jgi:hypothetical protein
VKQMNKGQGVWVQAVYLLFLSCLLLAGCQNQPTPTPVAQEPESTATTAATATRTPRPATDTPRPTTRPTNTAEPTDTPTTTPTLTPTPEPSVMVQVIDESSGDPVSGATVHLIHAEGEYDDQATTDEEGQIVFEDIILSTQPYTIEVTAEGYQLAVLELAVAENENELTVELLLQVLAEVTVESANLRSGPSTAFASLGEVNQGDMLTVTGQSEDGEWLVVETSEGEAAWLALSAVTLQQGELTQVAALPSPPTPTPAPTTIAVIAPPPPPSGPPVGANLLINPGFEEGQTGWTRLDSIFRTSDYPNFIHSGDASSLAYYGYQIVSGTTAGATYRVGAWVKLWSSSGEDRTISQDPGPEVFVDLCLNSEANINRWVPTSACVSARPIDTWQYISVDQVATGDRLAVILYLRMTNNNLPYHNEAIWDDVYLGLSPIAATPVPPPPGPPVPPAPIAFDAVALRDDMVQMQSLIEQIGGLLDRVYNGETGKCSDYISYYRQVVESPTYHSVPPEWEGVYNEYVWASNNVRGSSDPIYQVCVAGRGRITAFAYGVARSGIFDALARLIPAVAQANSLLGQ